MRNLKRSAAASLAVLAFYPWGAAAQFDGLSQTAVAVQGYEKSAGHCFYEPIVGRALDRLREHYAKTELYRWQRALRETVDADEMVRNLMGFALQNSPDMADPRANGPPKPAAARADRDCAASGLSVGSALPFAGPLIGFDPTLFAEANRLMEGKARALATVPRSQPEVASPAPNTPSPTARAAVEPARPAMSSVPSPEDVVRRFIDYGVTGREKLLTGAYGGNTTAVLRGLFSKGFVRDWERAWASGENIFDGSIISGLPSVESTRLAGVWGEADTGGLALVAVTLDVRADGETINRDQAFVLVREDDVWKIDEIVYGRKGDATALHSILKAAVPSTGAPEAKR